MSKKHLGSGRNTAFAKLPHRPSTEARARPGGNVVRVLTGVPRNGPVWPLLKKEHQGWGWRVTAAVQMPLLSRALLSRYISICL